MAMAQIAAPSVPEIGRNGKRKITITAEMRARVRSLRAVGVAPKKIVAQTGLPISSVKRILYATASAEKELLPGTKFEFVIEPWMIRRARKRNVSFKILHHQLWEAEKAEDILDER